MLNTGKIQYLREALDITQEAAAKKAGLKGRQQWNNIESGRNTNIKLDTLYKIAAALGVKAKDLLK